MVSRHLDVFELGEPSRYRVAKIAFRQNREYVFANLSLYNLTEEHLNSIIDGDIGIKDKLFT